MIATVIEPCRFCGKREDDCCHEAFMDSTAPKCVMCGENADDEGRYCSKSCDWSENGPPDLYWESYGSASENAGRLVASQEAARRLK